MGSKKIALICGYLRKLGIVSEIRVLSFVYRVKNSIMLLKIGAIALNHEISNGRM